MSRRPAKITQAEVERIIRAAKAAGALEVAVKIGERPSLRINLSVEIEAIDRLIAEYRDIPEQAACAPVTLYRYFGAGSILLYVGISRDVWKRQSEHRLRSPWYDLVVRVETETHPSRYAAQTAEIKAIRTEKPLYNIIGRER